MQDDKLELKAWLRLLTCTNLIEGQVRTLLRERFDTTLPRFDLLAQLQRSPAGLSMGELSSRLMVTGGNVTALVDALEQDGLVARGSHPSDRRSQVIRLTPKGRRVFNEMTPAHEQWVDALMAKVSRADLAALFQLLGKLKSSVQEAGRKT
ncbi:MAG: MarR family transcriptional regulator [Proteobacteria bacterium]|nr:MarR family transcriptional regulator [Pseudomonadota bacterium]